MFIVPSRLRHFGVFILLPCLTGLLNGASVIQLNRVSLDKIGRNEWLRTRIQISASANPSQEVKNSRFIDDVKVKLYLSFGDRKNGFSFYSSDVDIVTLEQGERYWVDFYIPGQIVKRDRLSTIPFAYLVEFEVGAHPLPHDSSFASSNMSNEAARIAFSQKAMESKITNDGILIPSFLAPHYLVIDDEERYPPYKRIPSSL